MVSDVLTSAKGTTFYVLTVAGEHGVSPPTVRSHTPTGDQNADEGQEEQGKEKAFMTDVAPKDGEEEEEEEEVSPPYIDAVDVPDSLIMHIKKQ